LRLWRPDDRIPFAALNADPKVMEHFPSTLTRGASDALADRIERHFVEHGFGLWAIEVLGVAPFVGFVGLSIPEFATHWNRGYATEGALAALTFGFETLGLQEIVSFTVSANAPSRRVMEKIGMVRDPDGDFDHPGLPESHPLRRHVLYRIGSPA
jgi:ribosomal-protein-alanine N-acetyltransferase